VRLIQKILEEIITSINGAQAVIFLDGDGETISQAGDSARDVKLAGAWKEIQFDHIKGIAERLQLGNVRAVLFSLEEGIELILPVTGEYCLLVFLSAYTDVQKAMESLKKAVALLENDIA
jgi:predicted regulator of Ras-like GTPase activity (Roadblock/LC7/MglB family)